jgi:hypothetical protein
MRTSFFITAMLILNLGISQTTVPVTWQVANANEVAMAYQKAYSWFTGTSNYAFKLKYISYKNHTSNEVREISEGYCKRFNNKHRTEALGTLMIQNEHYKAMIDTVDKLIVISNTEKSAPVMADVKEMMALLKNTKALKKKMGTNNVSYRIEFNKNSAYEMYEFTVNNKGYLEKLVYYYSEQTEEHYPDEESVKPVKIRTKPRLEIAFSAYEVPAKITEADFSEKNIVMADPKKIVLLNNYKSYQVKDYRH